MLRFHQILRPNKSFIFFCCPLLLIYSPVIQGRIHNSDILSAIGRPFAITTFMILVLIRMKVLPEKRMELSQAMKSLSGSIRMENGCQRCDFCQSSEDENRFFLFEEWDTQENLMTHLKSEHFRVLRGAMNLLRESYERRFYSVFYPEGIKEF
jgi:quinol monooxygenase YgiN